MTPDRYVLSVIARYQLPAGPSSPGFLAGVELSGPIRAWARKYLINVTYCGSYAKGTRVRGSTDVDLLVSLGPRTPGTPQQVFDHFFAYLKTKGYAPKRQNISIGVLHSGLKVDLIPARQEWGGSGDHAIFETERRRSTRTNFDVHTATVLGSGRADEIRAVKVWRDLRRIRFPSFYLELAVLEALKDRPQGAPGDNFIAALEYFRDQLAGTPIHDPANPENTISDDLTDHEQVAIADAAEASLDEDDWAKIIW